MIELEDSRAGKIADVMSNKSAKKILNILSEKEMSVNEIGRELGMRLNSVLYNIKNLVESGLIEETKGFLWSIKGKRIKKYKISNKRIVISPRRLVSGVIPAVLISGIVAFGIKLLTDTKFVGNSIAKEASKISAPAFEIARQSNGTAQSAWLWFLAGALFGLFVYLIWNLVMRKFRFK